MTRMRMAVPIMFPFSPNMNLLIIILAVVLALLGFRGGTWFWQKMAESPTWEQKRKVLKIAGLGGASGLFAVVIFLVWKMETQFPEFFRQYIPCINIGTWFLFFYLLGYDGSILSPKPGEMKAPQGNEKGTLKLYIKWNLLRKALFTRIIAIAPAVALSLFSPIDVHVSTIWIAGVVGFAVGFVFWEHMMDKGTLTGTFKYLLVIASLLTTAFSGWIAGYGLYVDCLAGNPESIKTLLVGLVPFIWCMAWYMLGLYVVVFRVK